MSNDLHTIYTADAVDPENVLTQYVPDDKVVKIYGRAKTIKYLSLFHGIINIFYMFTSFWFYGFFALLCFLGYKGAKEYKYNYTLFYMIYNIIDIIGQIVLIYYINVNKNDDNFVNNNLIIYYIIQSFIFIINFYLICNSVILLLS